MRADDKFDAQLPDRRGPNFAARPSRKRRRGAVAQAGQWRRAHPTTIARPARPQAAACAVHRWPGLGRLPAALRRRPPHHQPPTTAAPATQRTPPAPGGQQTFEQFQAQHPIAINAADYTVTPPGLAEAKAAQAAAAQQLSLARAGRGGDPNKSLSDYNTATQAVNKLQQDAQAKSLELQQAAQKNALDTQRQLYGEEMTRQQQAKLKADELAQAAKLKADELAQAAAEADKNRQATQQFEQTKAGQTFHQSSKSNQPNTRRTTPSSPWLHRRQKRIR